MITTASQEHLHGIRELWQQAFGDSVEYINLFLERCAQPQDTLVYLQDNTVSGMLFILSSTLVFHESHYRCAYLYAIATHKELRGRGISTQLLQYAYQLCRQRGYAASALVPATPSLFSFYAKRGYAVQGVTKTLSVEASKLDSAPSAAAFSPIGAPEIFAMRKKQFGDAYLEWDNKQLRYMQAENQFRGGSFFHYKVGGDSGYLCCVPHHNTLLVKELAGNDALLPELLAGLHKLYRKESYLVRLSGAAAVGTLTPFAMTRWMDKGPSEPFYLSLTLE